MKLFSKPKIKEKSKEIYDDYIENVIEGKSFIHQTINNDVVNGTIYLNCNFSWVTFENIIFEDVVFINCKFTSSNFKNCSVSYMKNLAFKECFINFCKFDNCLFSKLSIIDTYLKNTKFINVNLSSSIFSDDCFVDVEFVNNCDLRGAIFLNMSSWFDVSFINEESFTKIDSLTRAKEFNYKDTHHFDKIGKPLITGKTKEQVVANTYMNFANQYKKNDIIDKYGKYFYKSKINLHRGLRGYKKIRSFFARVSCGYGEKWLNGVGLSFFIIVLSAFLYYFGGLRIADGSIIDYNIFPISELLMINGQKILDFGECLFFSMVTFTTVGYGHSQAIGSISRTTSFIEMYLGVIIVAVITGALLRKLFR